jgi:GNAT superfamily N-acetyltransferase
MPETQSTAETPVEIKISRPSLAEINQEELKSLIADFAKETYKPIQGGEHDVQEDIDLYTKIIFELIAQNKFYIAKHEDKIIGFVGLQPKGQKPDKPGRNVFEIRFVYTVPEHRERKVSKQLESRFQADLEAEDPSAILIVGSENPIILSHYEKIGFREEIDPGIVYQTLVSKEGMTKVLADRIRDFVDTRAADPEFKFLFYDSEEKTETPS